MTGKTLRHSGVAVVGAIALTVLTSGIGGAGQRTLQVWPGVAPGSESWTQKEITYKNTPLGTVIIDVVNPTLTAYLPARNKANGTGVIVAPGGACVALAIDLEANKVAESLQKRGVAAFVLKYRTLEKKQDGIPDVDPDQACKFGMADGVQALKVVRQHASEFGISPDRVGFIGFSAGGMVASAALLQPDLQDRPNFAAFIYGAPFGVMPPIPSKLPPTFVAWAQDDTVALGAIVKFYDALRTAGNKPETHIFSSGGHGFGMKKSGATSDRWIDEFYFWLEARGFMKPLLR